MQIHIQRKTLIIIEIKFSIEDIVKEVLRQPFYKN